MDNSELLYQAHDSHTAWMESSEMRCCQRLLAGLEEHLLPCPGSYCKPEIPSSDTRLILDVRGKLTAFTIPALSQSKCSFYFNKGNLGYSYSILF